MTFERGYDYFRREVANKSHFVKSCFNCRYYESDKEFKKSTEEFCQNDDVTEYDVITDENRVYCTQWQPVRTSKESQIFKKTGRDRIDEMFEQTKSRTRLKYK